MLINSPHLKEMFDSPPMASYRQPPNLRRLICKSKLYPLSRNSKLQRGTHKNAPGWKKCSKPCHICPFTLPDCQEVVRQISGCKHKIKDPLNCESQNCVYYWKCVKPNCPLYPKCEYLGMTSRKFKTRMGEHRDYVKREVLTEPAGEHFNSSGHNVRTNK